MKVSNFDFHLPPELIAQYPQPERASSKLLSLDKHSGACQHLVFADLLTLLQPHDLLVFNNTRVIPARLFGHKKTGGKIEILVERILNDGEALAHVRSNKTCRLPLEIALSNGVMATVIERHDNLFKLVFATSTPLIKLLHDIGHIPLPGYIERADEKVDLNRYQTVYAEKPGAVAAPTAGLHFDEVLLKQLQAKNIQTTFVTLHVGAGTFQPVRCENLIEHKMHSEWMEVSQATCDAIATTKKRGGRVIAVGTTSVRCLETCGQNGLQPYQGETAIFIYPGYQFNVIDGLITNFHWPRSTLLMLVSALAGKENILAAYQSAIEHHYRFFSYGDAMVIV